jgi:predicted esterase
VVYRSATRPPRAKLLELDRTVGVAVDGEERGANLRLTVADAERIEQQRKLSFIDHPVLVAIDALEAGTQRILTHALRLRRRAAQINRAALLGCSLLVACRSTPESLENRPNLVPGRATSVATVAPAASVDPLPLTAHPQLNPAAGSGSPALPALRGEWLERFNAGDREVIVTPPLGAIAKSRLIVAVHGAGDRPEWACGGWRLASQASAFVVCPRGSKSSAEKLAWTSPQQLAQNVAAALDATLPRYERYIDTDAFIFAGFSQGATLAEPFLRQNAARFPIAILAEGGYDTARSPAFARAFQEAGGRRIALVCGSQACFRSAARSKPVLERAGLEVLVIGDAKAGHNLNERMQRSLQSAWPDISAPLPGR